MNGEACVIRLLLDFFVVKVLVQQIKIKAPFKGSVIILRKFESLWDFWWTKWHWDMFLRVLRIFPVNIIPLELHTHILSGGWTTDLLNAAVRRQFHPVNVNKNKNNDTVRSPPHEMWFRSFKSLPDCNAKIPTLCLSKANHFSVGCFGTRNRWCFEFYDLSTICLLKFALIFSFVIIPLSRD